MHIQANRHNFWWYGIRSIILAILVIFAFMVWEWIDPIERYLPW